MNPQNLAENPDLVCASCQLWLWSCPFYFCNQTLPLRTHFQLLALFSPIVRLFIATPCLFFSFSIHTHTQLNLPYLCYLPMYGESTSRKISVPSKRQRKKSISICWLFWKTQQSLIERSGYSYSAETSSLISIMIQVDFNFWILAPCWGMFV